MHLYGYTYAKNNKGLTYLWSSLSWQRYKWPYKTSLRMAHSSKTHDQLTELDEICFYFWQQVTIFLLTLPHTVPMVWGKIQREHKDIMPINNWCCAKSQKVSRGSRWFETNYITRRFLYCSKEPSIKDVQLFQGKGGLMLQKIRS